jgi:hypothetical protein
MLKTNNLMQRDFDGVSISQRTKDSYFNATELLNVYNSNSDKQKTIKDFWGNKGTDDFMTSLVNQLNNEAKLNGAFSPYLESDLFSAKKGRGGQTYMHPN